MVKLGQEAGELGRVGPAQQVADEEAVPGELGDDPHVQPVGGVGAGVEVLDEELAALMCARMSASSAAKCAGAIGALFSHQTSAVDRGLADDELVLGAAAGVAAGGDQEGAALAELALAARDRRLDQRGFEQVVVRRAPRRRSRSPRASSAG